MWVYTKTSHVRKILNLEFGIRIEIVSSAGKYFLQAIYPQREDTLCGPFSKEEAEQWLEQLATVMECKDLADPDIRVLKAVKNE